MSAPRCRYYFTSKGCRNGSSCRFSHDAAAFGPEGGSHHLPRKAPPHPPPYPPPPPPPPQRHGNNGGQLHPARNPQTSQNCTDWSWNVNYDTAGAYNHSQYPPSFSVGGTSSYAAMGDNSQNIHGWDHNRFGGIDHHVIERKNQTDQSGDRGSVHENNFELDRFGRRNRDTGHLPLGNQHPAGARSDDRQIDYSIDSHTGNVHSENFFSPSKKCRLEGHNHMWSECPNNKYSQNFNGIHPWQLKSKGTATTHEQSGESQQFKRPIATSNSASSDTDFAKTCQALIANRNESNTTITSSAQLAFANGKSDSGEFRPLLSVQQSKTPPQSASPDNGKPSTSMVPVVGNFSQGAKNDSADSDIMDRLAVQSSAAAPLASVTEPKAVTFAEAESIKINNIPKISTVTSANAPLRPGPRFNNTEASTLVNAPLPTKKFIPRSQRALGVQRRILNQSQSKPTIKPAVEKMTKVGGQWRKEVISQAAPVGNGAIAIKRHKNTRLLTTTTISPFENEQVVEDGDTSEQPVFDDPINFETVTQLNQRSNKSKACQDDNPGGEHIRQPIHSNEISGSPEIQPTVQKQTRHSGNEPPAGTMESHCLSGSQDKQESNATKDDNTNIPRKTELQTKYFERLEDSSSSGSEGEIITRRCMRKKEFRPRNQAECATPGSSDNDDDIIMERYKRAIVVNPSDKTLQREGKFSHPQGNATDKEQSTRRSGDRHDKAPGKESVGKDDYGNGINSEQFINLMEADERERDGTLHVSNEPEKSTKEKHDKELEGREALYAPKNSNSDGKILQKGKGLGIHIGRILADEYASVDPKDDVPIMQGMKNSVGVQVVIERKSSEEDMDHQDGSEDMKRMWFEAWDSAKQFSDGVSTSSSSNQSDTQLEVPPKRRRKEEQIDSVENIESQRGSNFEYSSALEQVAGLTQIEIDLFNLVECSIQCSRVMQSNGYLGASQYHRWASEDCLEESDLLKEAPGGISETKMSDNVNFPVESYVQSPDQLDVLFSQRSEHLYDRGHNDHGHDGVFLEKTISRYSKTSEHIVHPLVDIEQLPVVGVNEQGRIDSDCLRRQERNTSETSHSSIPNSATCQELDTSSESSYYFDSDNTLSSEGAPAEDSILRKSAKYKRKGKNHDKWEIYFKELVKFKKKHGHLTIQQNFRPQKTLGFLHSWLHRQKNSYKKGLLPSGYAEKLMNLGDTLCSKKKAETRAKISMNSVANKAKAYYVSQESNIESTGEPYAMNIVHNICSTSFDENGFPRQKITVMCGDSEMLYDFQIDIRESTIPNAGNGAFLTFLGARKLNQQSASRSERLLQKHVVEDAMTEIEPLVAIMPGGLRIGVTVTGQNLYRNDNNPYWSKKRSTALFQCIQNDTISSDFDENSVQCEIHQEVLELRSKVEDGKRIGFLGIHSESDYVEANDVLFWSGPESMFEIGRYGPIRPEDRKTELHFSMKNFIHDFEPAEWSYDVDENIMGDCQLIDITDDATGEVHSEARKHTPIYVNEIGHNKNLCANVRIMHKNDRSVYYYACIGKEHAMKKGDCVELLADYGKLYENVRERKGYGVANLYGKVGDDSDRGAKMQRNFAARQSIESEISKLSIVRLFYLAEFLMERIYAKINRSIYGSFQCCSPMTVRTRSLVARRRLHWIGERLEQQLERILGSSVKKYFSINGTFISTIRKIIYNFKWSTLPQIQNVNEDCVLDEVSEELLYKASNNIPKPFDTKKWCQLGNLVMDSVTRKIAFYVLNAEYGQETLAEAILDDAEKFAKLALLCSKKLSESNEPYSGDINNFFEILSVESLLHRINQRQLYYQDTDDVVFFKPHPISDVPENSNEFKKSVICVHGSTVSGLATGHMSQYCWMACSLETIKNGKARVNVEWYLMNQVLMLVHLLASFCVEWMITSSGQLPYSLEKLCEAVGAEMTDVMVAISNGFTLPDGPKEEDKP